VIVIGDVHREWDAFARRLRFYGITQQQLIQVGDFGVGVGPLTVHIYRAPYRTEAHV
jgi:hypothetical protein